MAKHNHFNLAIQAATQIFIITLLGGCNLYFRDTGVGQGPAAWIDRPLQGDEIILPQTVTILAHASDIDGVASFKFFNAENLLSVVPADGKRLAEASLEWQPPEPGIYTLGVLAEDSAGNQGSLTTVEVNVIGEKTKPALANKTPTPAPAYGQCSPEALTAPQLLSPADGSSAKSPVAFTWSYPDNSCHPYSFTVDISPDTSFADNSLGFGTENYKETSREWPLPTGKCYYWRVKAYVPDTDGPASSTWKFCIASPLTDTPSSPVFVLAKNANCRLGPGTAYKSVDAYEQGTQVNIEGRSENGSWLWVVKPPSGKHCWISTSVGTTNGNWQSMPVITAIPLPATDTPVPADVTPPAISDLNINPALVSAQQQCGATPAAAVVTARVSDAGGLQRVIARISGVGEFDMSSAGGNLYQVNIGPFNEAGTYSVFIQAADTAGNSAVGGPLNLQVVACPG